MKTSVKKSHSCSLEVKHLKPLLDIISGGTSGNAEDKNIALLDCTGACYGDWLEDSCGVCGPPYGGEFGSIFKDCNDKCYKPGIVNQTLLANVFRHVNAKCRSFFYIVLKAQICVQISFACL